MADGITLFALVVVIGPLSAVFARGVRRFTHLFLAAKYGYWMHN